MWLFPLLAFLSVFVALILRGGNSPQASRVYLCIIFFILSFLMMFRGVSVGNDTVDYVSLFEIINQQGNLFQFISETRYEAGYVLLNRAIGVFVQNPQWILILSGAFTAWAFARFFYQYSCLPWMSVFMFLTLQFFDLSMSAVRQILAISVLLCGYDDLVLKRPFRFAAWVLLASTLHGSCILFGLLYPLAAAERTKRFFLVSAGIALGVFAIFPVFFALIGKVFPGYIHYLTQSSGSYSNSAKLANVLMFLLYLGLFVLMSVLDRSQLPAPKDAGVRQRMFSRCFERAAHVHQLAIWMAVIMLLLSLQGTILNRFKYIFAFPLLVAFPNAIRLYANPKNKNLIAVASCLVFFAYISIIYYLRPEWQSTYPFVPFWDDTPW